VGARQDAIEQAAAALHEARRAWGRPISVGVEFVAMRENLGQLSKLVRWAARRRFEFVIATHMLPYAPEMANSADPARPGGGALQLRARSDGAQP
jgi:hypothetical protein